MQNFCDFGELNNSNNDDEYIYELYGVIVIQGHLILGIIMHI